MTEWESVKLSQLCQFRAGSAFPPDEQGRPDGALPFIKVSDLSVSSGDRDVVGARNWLTSDQRARLRPATAPAGASVFAKIGEGLRAERVRYLSRETAFDNNLMAAIPRPGVVDSLFLFYLLRVVGLSDLAVGSALPYIKQGDLNEVGCLVPVLGEQQAIAEVLGALDDKIAANDQLTTTADDLLAAHSEKATAQGQEVPLSSLARFVNGRAFTKGASGTGRVVIRIAELNSGIGGSTVYNDIEVADDHLARPGDLLFAWSGSLTVKRWFRPEAIVNQHIFKVVPTTAPMWVVKGALDRKLVDFRAIAADKATTMGHIQRRHLDEPVRVPPVETISAMDAVMTGLWNRALSAEVESLQLIELRDTLLPALMSGRLSVKDAESTVSEVV